MSGDDIGGAQPSRRDLRRAESSGTRAAGGAPAGFSGPTSGAHPARRDLRATPPPMPLASQPAAPQPYANRAGVAQPAVQPGPAQPAAAPLFSPQPTPPRPTVPPANPVPQANTVPPAAPRPGSVPNFDVTPQPRTAPRPGLAPRSTAALQPSAAAEFDLLAKPEAPQPSPHVSRAEARRAEASRAGGVASAPVASRAEQRRSDTSRPMPTATSATSAPSTPSTSAPSPATVPAAAPASAVPSVSAASASAAAPATSAASATTAASASAAPAASAPAASTPPAAPAAPSHSVRPARPVAERRRRNGPARVFATVLVVPAIVGTVALPAYAFAPGTGAGGPSSFFRNTLAGAQALDVSILASEGAVSTDAYAVTTKAEIDRIAAEQEAADQAAWAASVANHSGAYYTPAQQAEGDDYPWWDQTPDDYGGGLSPLRYYFRECVDFVAWRMNRDQGVTSAPWKWDWSNLASGSAYAWADEWVSRGRQTSSEPIVGAVAWFPYNHVAYVQAVNGDGTVTIEEYNQNSDHSYHVRTIPVGSALYLYPPA
ncbi:CHAP domain-containing protein [Agromyces larvae]|uniref:CHAP domain-containing protein n=1 Tax=Agromyces larvae TaxID=2929802 RepID=A0ABY4C4F9_9MICO|nr:CHAP domain-containing protein [Agromyces larvae]UOE45854.1 CHAP domain-containing protein [Agromyces larvae]